MGDGNFKWFHAHSEDSEHWSMENSREAAIQAGTTDYNGEPFVIAEWDKSVCVPPPVDDLLEFFTDANEMCWGEDGPDDPWGQEAVNELEALIKSWFVKYPARTYMFDAQRSFKRVTP